jgi:hypothetical protein
MNDVPQNRDAVEAARRVDANDEAVRAQLVVAQNYRYAAVLNALRVAKDQGGSPDFTGEDVDRIRQMWGMVDDVITYGEGERIPEGFGPIARSQYMVDMAKAALASAEKQVRAQAEADLATRKGRTKVTTASEGSGGAAPTTEG